MYASGFLYHAKTDQILLQQLPTSDSSPVWSLFSTTEPKQAAPEKIFAALIKKVLKIPLDPKKIHEVYTYATKKGDGDCAILYAEITKMQEFKPVKGTRFAWFSRKQITKLPLSSQSKQDVIVGTRVIDASVRKSLGQHTLE